MCAGIRKLLNYFAEVMCTADLKRLEKPTVGVFEDISRWAPPSVPLPPVKGCAKMPGVSNLNILTTDPESVRQRLSEAAAAAAAADTEANNASAKFDDDRKVSSASSESESRGTAADAGTSSSSDLNDAEKDPLLQTLMKHMSDIGLSPHAKEDIIFGAKSTILATTQKGCKSTQTPSQATMASDDTVDVAKGSGGDVCENYVRERLAELKKDGTEIRHYANAVLERIARSCSYQDVLSHYVR